MEIVYYVLGAAIAFVVLALCIQVGVQAALKSHYMWVERREYQKRGQELWREVPAGTQAGGFPVVQGPQPTPQASPTRPQPRGRERETPQAR